MLLTTRWLFGAYDFVLGTAAGCVKYGGWAAAGIFLQGVFTLEMSLSPQSFIHWGAAVLLMMGTMDYSETRRRQ